MKQQTLPLLELIVALLGAHDITSPSAWRSCPTSSNLADIINRGVDGKAFISSWADSWLTLNQQATNRLATGGEIALLDTIFTFYSRHVHFCIQNSM